MPVSEQTYHRVALEDPERHWELRDGLLREKPAMSWEHHDLMSYLGIRLGERLDPRAFRVHINSTRLRRTPETYFVPDVCVIPASLFQVRRAANPGRLEIYDEPMPLVAEVWSPSTGDYDVDAKIPQYRQRGDLEIWRLHPYQRTLTAWRRQPDDTYTITEYRGGIVRPVALPDVAIDLDALFDFR